MKFRSHILPALVAGVSLSPAAMAATPLQTTVTANPAAAVSSTLEVSRNGAGASTGVAVSGSASTVQLAKFNPALGILTGATVSVSTPVSVTVTALGTVPTSGNGRTVDASLSASGIISGAGLNLTGGALTASASCSAGNCSNGTQNQTSTTSGTLTGSSAVAAASLGAYHGAGTVALTRTASGAGSVTNGSRVTTGTARGSYTFGGATAANNSYSITYDYLNFANASFSGGSTSTSLDLDFGTVVQGSGPVTLSFSLFNIGNANTADLALASFGRSDNDARFSTDLATFNDLAGGGSRTFSMVLNPTTLGIANDLFTLNLADFVPGGIGGRSYTLSLKTTGNIVAPPLPPVGPTVPEPATWAMMIAGFGLVGNALRRRNRIARVTA